MRISDWSSDVCSSDLSRRCWRSASPPPKQRTDSRNPRRMLYNLLVPLADSIPLFNLFRYLTFRSGGAVITALTIAFLIGPAVIERSEEHTSELQSLMRISYAVFCLKKTNKTHTTQEH